MGICSLRWSTAFRRRFAGIPAKAGTPANEIRNARRRGFTLVELLVVITIIALLAAVTLGALAKTREVACLDATKATIDKLNMLVMRKYESYSTRRIPLNLPPMPCKKGGSPYGPVQYAMLRMQAIRDLMRMEMPERWCDIWNPSNKALAGPTGTWDSGWTATLPSGQSWVVPPLASPSLQQLYFAKLSNPAAFGMKTPVTDHQQAKCLYMWVMNAIPEAKTMFAGSEIADVDGDGWKVFIDGWGNPIGFLRWAPGATVTLNAGTPVAGANGQIGWSDVQIDDTAGNNLHHDPFDPNFVEPNAYHLYPLIFAGVLGKTSGVDDYGIVLGNTGDPVTVSSPTVDPFSGQYLTIGSASSTGGAPLVHNHHMEQK
jgi:prepilin-type N-terminal cleavage/methylation domain-containing protein